MLSASKSQKFEVGFRFTRYSFLLGRFRSCWVGKLRIYYSECQENALKMSFYGYYFEMDDYIVLKSYMKSLRNAYGELNKLIHLSSVLSYERLFFKHLQTDKRKRNQGEIFSLVKLLFTVLYLFWFNFHVPKMCQPLAKQPGIQDTSRLLLKDLRPKRTYPKWLRTLLLF